MVSPCFTQEKVEKTSLLGGKFILTFDRKKI